DFYQRAEAETGERFFARRPMVRLFRDDRERAVFADRAGTEFRGLVNPSALQLDESWFAAPFGGFEMTAAGQLAVGRYLDASRAHFSRAGDYRTGDVRTTDVELEPGGVRLPRFGAAARAVVFCQGTGGAENPWFRHVPFTPAKGEILTLRVPGL